MNELLKPAFILTAMSVCGLTVVISMALYAASTPSHPRTLMQEINRCINNAEGRLYSMRIDEHNQVSMACAKALEAVN